MRCGLCLRLGCAVTAPDSASYCSRAARPPTWAEPSSLQEYLGSIRPDRELQAFLDGVVNTQMAADPTLRRATVGVALLDLGHGGAPRLAQFHGEVPIYPASVVKFVI